MERGVSSLIFVLILIIFGWYFWIYFSPYYFHDTTPNVPMQTVIGDKAWYFPMGYIDPHYPDATGHDAGYSRGGETEVWLSLDATDFKIVPQDVSEETFGLGRAIDVILTSDRNPKTAKAMKEFIVMQKELGTFQPVDNGLRMQKIGNRTEYMAEDTRISCDNSGLCTLFSTRIPDVRTAIVFNAQFLPGWQQILNTLAIELQPFRTRPPWSVIFHDFFTTRPAGTQRASTSSNGVLMPPNSIIPETTVPSLNIK